MPVYSQILLGVSGVAGATFTVPDGFTGVLRDLTIVSLEQDGTYWAARDSASALLATGTWPDSTSSEYFAYWNGRQVINAGDTIEFFGDATSLSIRACGYLLRA